MIEFCSAKAVNSSLAEAVPTMLKELNYDSVDRVETFYTLARQAEQAERNGKTPQHTRDHWLAGARERLGPRSHGH